MELTRKQVLILWALISRPGGAAFQKDIKPLVDRADRNALQNAGLIASAKTGRAITLEATEKGWGWAAEHLDAELPANSPAGSQILRAWLTQLKVFLSERGFALADFFVTPARGPEPSLEDRIRSAYLAASAGAFNQHIFLSNLRERLSDVPRATLDAALIAMHERKGSHLSGADNPIELSAADRAASLAYKGEPMYVLWIAR